MPARHYRVKACWVADCSVSEAIGVGIGSIELVRGVRASVWVRKDSDESDSVAALPLSIIGS